MIKEYIKRPVKIEAVEWTGSNIREIFSFCPVAMLVEHDFEVDLEIDTLEGVHKANVGDYIIKGIKGEYYPCKPDIFKETYYEVKHKE